MEYRRTAAVFSIEEARKAGAPRVWDEGNVLPPIIETFGNIKKSFEDADLILEGDYSTSRHSRAQLNLQFHSLGGMETN